MIRSIPALRDWHLSQASNCRRALAYCSTRLHAKNSTEQAAAIHKAIDTFRQQAELHEAAAEVLGEAK